MPLSRRQFLQLTGIAVLGTAVDLPTLPTFAAVPTEGRALHALPVRARPHPDAPIIRHLWPDSLLPITALPGTWYSTSDGYIEKAHVQPILAAPVSQMLAAQMPRFWAEVNAPAAAVREWCAADAPLITRIGHGGVMRIIDQLPGDPAWYGVADEHGALLGWTPAPLWQSAQPGDAQATLEIHIDQKRQQMWVLAGDVTIVRADVSTGQHLTPGSYTLERGNTPGVRLGEYYGASWPLHFADAASITGVYWHNQFGTAVPGPAVQVPVYLARWLHNTCADGSRVVVF